MILSASLLGGCASQAEFVGTATGAAVGAAPVNGTIDVGSSYIRL
jgi:hypothetical protein